MRNPTETIKPKEIIEIILKRRWHIIITFCLLMIAGICSVFFLPKAYTSSTLILIQPQKMPEEFLRSLGPVLQYKLGLQKQAINQT